MFQVNFDTDELYNILRFVDSSASFKITINSESYFGSLIEMLLL